MKLYEIYNQNPERKALVIGGHHGDEPIGVEICKKLTEITPANDGLRIISMANRPAYIAKTREFEGIDLNRAYGNEKIDMPELNEMVNTIKKLAADSCVVIDCHSTPMEGLQEIAIFPNHAGKKLAPYMGLPFYWQEAPENSLRYFCDSINVPAITFEGVNELHNESVEAGVAGILSLLNKLKIL